MWATLAFAGTAGLFLFWAISTLWHIRWVRRLPTLETLTTAPTTRGIKCSIVIAARDEAARIEQTIRRLFAQREVELEVIVVDDRSTDGTSEILRRLTKEDSRLHVKRVDVLPDGWLGKCHACHIGANAATGDWILFTDADCWLQPDVIARALRVVERDQADHVTLISGLDGGSVGLKASHLMFLISLANWISGVNRDRPKAFMGLARSTSFARRLIVIAAATKRCA